MSRIKITATDAGFFNLSPLGKSLAPNVFLKTAVNIRGEVLGADNWQSAESAMYSDFGIDVDASAPTSARLGMLGEVLVSGLSYYRVEEGEKVVIGSIEFAAPLHVKAQYDELADGTFGWIADAGVALQNALKTDGFVFKGGAGDDNFAPHIDMVPAYGTNILRGRGGDDTLVGGLGDDRISGGNGDDTLSDFGGQNVLFGRAGNDTIKFGDYSDESQGRGGKGDDTLISGAGDDWLFGGKGDDVLHGGSGDNHLRGGKGDDMFVFDQSDRGTNVISDFVDGQDMLVMQGINGFTEIEVLDTDAGSIVSWGGNSEVLLQGVAAELIDVSDFIFQ